MDATPTYLDIAPRSPSSASFTSTCVHFLVCEPSSVSTMNPLTNPLAADRVSHGVLLCSRARCAMASWSAAVERCLEAMEVD